MQFTLISSPFRPLELEQVDETPEQIEKRLSVVQVRDQKEGQAIIPVQFRKCPPRCWASGKRTSNCGGGKLHRLALNVEAMTGFTADIDEATEGGIEEIFTHVASLGVLAFCWQTYSHTQGAPRYRLLVPFSEPLPLHNARAWSHSIWPRLTKHFKVDGPNSKSDNQTRDPARLYYLPSSPSEDEFREVGVIRGPLFNARSVIKYSISPAKPLKIKDCVPIQQDPTREIDIALIRSKVNKFSTHERLMLAGKPLAEPSSKDKRTHTHYEAWLSALGCLSQAIAGWEHRETVLNQIALQSWLAEEAEEPNPGTSWDILTRLFDGACDTVGDHRARLLAISQARLEEKRALLSALTGRK